MIVSTPTKLSLNDFAYIIGINPLHFAQLTKPVSSTRSRQSCDQAYFRYDWQDADRVSREAVAIAIAQAEARCEEYLNYRLAPTWEVDEWRATERPFQPEYLNYNARDVRGYGIVTKARWGHFISGGVKAKTVIEAGAAIIWSDVDGDGYDETGTVVVTVDPAINPCEIRLYYPSHDGDDLFEIRPISQISIVADQATIVFARHLAVKEELQGSFYPTALEPTDDANFLSELDVYRVYNDPQVQASMLWEPTGCSFCGGDGCASCSYAIQSGCLHVRGNPRISEVVATPADWNSDTLGFDSVPFSVGKTPDIVRLFYFSGLRDKTLMCSNFDMDRQWKRTIAHFACSLLERPPCDCVETEWQTWRNDLALTSGGGEDTDQHSTYQISASDLSCPFGTRRGAIDAWHQVLRNAIGQAVVP